MVNKNIKLSSVDEIDDLPDDAVVVFDDKPRKFNPDTFKFVNPWDDEYDDLPEIEY